MAKIKYSPPSWLDANSITSEAIDNAAAVPYEYIEIEIGGKQERYEEAKQMLINSGFEITLDVPAATEYDWFELKGFK